MLFFSFFISSFSKESKYSTCNDINYTIFKWEKAFNFWRKAFNGRKVGKYHFKSEDPDLELLAHKAAEKMIGTTGLLKHLIDQKTYPYIYHPAEENYVPPDEDQPGGFHLLSQPLVIDDAIKRYTFDLESLNFTENQSTEFKRGLYSYSAESFPLIFISALAIAYYVIFLSVCLLPIFRGKRSTKASIKVLTFYFIGIVVVLFGLISTTFSYFTFVKVKDNFLELPKQVNQTFDRVIELWNSASNELQKVLIPEVAIVNASIIDLDQKAQNYFPLFAKLIDSINRTDLSDPTNSSFIPYYYYGMKKYIDIYTRDLINQYLTAYYQEKYYESNTLYDLVVDEKLHDMKYNLELSLDFFNNITSLMDSLYQVTVDKYHYNHFIKEISNFIESFSRHLSLSDVNFTYDQTLGQKISNLKNSAGVQEISKYVDDVKTKYIDPYYNLIYLAFTVILIFNLVYLIVYSIAFLTPSCFSGCLAANAEIYPLIATAVFCVCGIYAFTYCGIFVFLGENFGKTLDTLINDVAQRSIESDTLVIPKLNLSTQSVFDLPEVEFPTISFSNISLVVPALQATLDTGFASLLSMSDNINLNAFKNTFDHIIDNYSNNYYNNFFKKQIDEFETKLKNNVFPTSYEPDLATQYLTGADNKLPVELLTRENIKINILEKFCEVIDENIVYTIIDQGEGCGNDCFKGDNAENTTFYDWCKARINDIKIPNGETELTLYESLTQYATNLSIKYGAFLDSEAKSINPTSPEGLIHFGSTFHKSLSATITGFKNLATTISIELPSIFNKVNADSLVDSLSYFYNHLVYDYAYMTTTLSVGLFFMVIGFIPTVILMCIRRKSLLPPDPNDAASSYYSTDSVSQEEREESELSGKSEGKNELSEISSTPTSSSSGRGKKRRNGLFYAQL